VKRAWPLLGLIGGGSLMLTPLHAADEPVDPDFLEFLGSVDSTEAGWHDYLAETDVDQVAKAQTGTPKPASPGTPLPVSGTEKVGQR
jgi:hypothetical protein